MDSIETIDNPKGHGPQRIYSCRAVACCCECQLALTVSLALSRNAGSQISSIQVRGMLEGRNSHFTRSALSEPSALPALREGLCYLSSGDRIVLVCPGRQQAEIRQSSAFSLGSIQGTLEPHQTKFGLHEWIETMTASKHISCKGSALVVFYPENYGDPSVWHSVFYSHVMPVSCSSRQLVPLLRRQVKGSAPSSRLHTTLGKLRLLSFSHSVLSLPYVHQLAQLGR